MDKIIYKAGELKLGSYTPLYRKYRPQKFDELIGQDSISKTLSNAVQLNRIAHAYLFTGPRGTGKTSSARIFAKSLNCVEGPTVTPCGKCSSCIDISNSNSVDVIEIDAASNRKVEDARNLLEKIQFVPVAGKYKIYIIDEVHMLTTEAFNTLLKTLEEPPPNLVFILATTEAHKVLNTIISRCQRFDFHRVSQDEIFESLKIISAKEGIEIQDKALSIIAKKAFGGMRDAIGLLDQASVIANQGKEITENDIITLLGSLPEETLFEITDTLANKNAESLIQLIEKIIQSSEPVNVIRELINYFRNILIIKTTDNFDKIKLLVDISESFLQKIKNQSDNFEVNEIIQIIEKLSEYEKTIKTTSQQHLWLEVALISICHRHDIQVIKDLENRIEKLEQAISSGKIPEIKHIQPDLSPVKEPAVACPAAFAAKPEPIDTPENEKPDVLKFKKSEETKETVKEEEDKSEKNIENADLNTCWKKMLASIAKINAPSEAFFKIFTPVEMNPEKIVITCKNEKWIDKAKKEKINLVEQASTEVFGTLPHIIIRTPMPEDEKNIKQKSETKITGQNPVSKPEPPKPKQVSQIAIDIESHEELDTEVVETLNEIEKKPAPANISEQAKMVIDIFNGKVID